MRQVPRKTSPGNDPTGSFAEAIAEAVVARLVPHLARLEELLEQPKAPPKLLTKSQLAESLQCSLAKVDGLIRAGMPGRRVGDVWRFELHTVLAWCDERIAEDEREAS